MKSDVIFFRGGMGSQNVRKRKVHEFSPFQLSIGAINSIEKSEFHLWSDGKIFKQKVEIQSFLDFAEVFIVRF